MTRTIYKCGQKIRCSRCGAILDVSVYSQWESFSKNLKQLFAIKRHQRKYKMQRIRCKE